jgi:hypothetical protein
MWCSDAGEHPDTQRSFGLRLSERGFDSFRYSGGVNKGRKGWKGIGIQSTDNQADGASDGSPSERNADNRSLQESPVDKPDAPNSPVASEPSEPKNDLNGLNHARDGITANSGSLHSLHSPGTVEELFANPPDWLKDQTTIYRRNPTERMLKPLCAAIAHELGFDAGEIRPEVERALGSRA